MINARATDVARALKEERPGTHHYLAILVAVIVLIVAAVAVALILGAPDSHTSQAQEEFSDTPPPLPDFETGSSGPPPLPGTGEEDTGTGPGDTSGTESDDNGGSSPPPLPDVEEEGDTEDSGPGFPE